jgi:sugar phosphate isomerase/epimerase
VGSFADTPERIEALLADVGRDNFALNYQVLDVIAPEAADAQPADAAALVEHARYFHLKNFRPNPDGGPLLPGGSLAGGVLDYRAILAAAFDAGYEDPLAIEFLSWDPLPIEEKLAADAAHLRALLAELGR